MRGVLLVLLLVLTACEPAPNGTEDIELGLPDAGSLDGTLPDLIEAGSDLKPLPYFHPRPSAFAMVEDLSALKMNGRKSGTPGGTLAAEYVAARLAECGIDPFGDKQGSYFQTFKVHPIVHTGAMKMSVTATGPAPAPVHHLTYRQQWRPGRTSPGADLTAPLVFAGFGLDVSAHDDYAQVEVKGKVTVLLRGCPASLKTQPGCNDLPKIQTAYKHQAAAVVLVTDNDTSVDKWGGSQGIPLLPIPVVVIKKGPADHLLPQGQSVVTLRGMLESGPQSFAVAKSLKLLMSRKVFRNADAHNVLGILRASRDAEVVLAGAHYDHLGLDEPPHAYFPGALDNASGTAVVIDAACRLAREFPVNRSRSRSMIFALWGAEEDGLLGSRHFVDSGRVKLQSITVAFNLDMVGGVGEGWALIDVDPPHLQELKPFIVHSAAAFGLPALVGPIVTGSSDHVNFMQRGVRTVYMRGPYPPQMEYHTRADTPAQVSASSLDLLGEMVAQMIWDLASSEAPIPDA